MADQISSLRQRFTALSDDELQNIAITGGLTDQASELLEQELRRRGIDDVGEYKEHLQRVDQERLEKKQKALCNKKKSLSAFTVAWGTASPSLEYWLVSFILEDSGPQVKKAKRAPNDLRSLRCPPQQRIDPTRQAFIIRIGTRFRRRAVPYASQYWY